MAISPLPPTPSEGGSYNFDPETGTYTRVVLVDSPATLEDVVAETPDVLPISDEESP